MSSRLNNVKYLFISEKPSVSHAVVPSLPDVCYSAAESSPSTNTPFPPVEKLQSNKKKKKYSIFYTFSHY